MARGKRLDVRLVELGLFDSRQAAQAAIMAGGVTVDGITVTKAGASVPEDSRLELAGSFRKPPYVSRGGLKLEKALATFAIPVSGRVCLDIGASTGGFTDCLLKQGAKRVYAVDVGYGQLAWSLRTDERVTVMERTNARNLKRADIAAAGEDLPDLAAIDVSFISILKILPALVASMAGRGSDFICLVKPQFEAGRSLVGKGGVIACRQVHADVVSTLIGGAAPLGLSAHGLTFSPLKGPAGNIEFLLWLKAEPAPATPDVASVVRQAHEELGAND